MRAHNRLMRSSKTCIIGTKMVECRLISACFKDLDWLEFIRMLASTVRGKLHNTWPVEDV